MSITYVLFDCGCCSGLVSRYCPVSVPSALSHFRDLVFKLCHRGADIIGSGFDVIRRRRAHVGVPEDSLDQYVGYADPI
jgi:hypothetical protein